MLLPEVSSRSSALCLLITSKILRPEVANSGNLSAKTGAGSIYKMCAFDSQVRQKGNAEIF
jgi:hypothetical protein